MSKYADVAGFCPNMTLGVHHQRAIFQKKTKNKKTRKGQRHDRVRAIQALPKVNQWVREERGKERGRGVLLM